MKPRLYGSHTTNVTSTLGNINFYTENNIVIGLLKTKLNAKFELNPQF